MRALPNTSSEDDDVKRRRFFEKFFEFFSIKNPKQ